MSLTSHLHDGGSPVRGWFAENLSQTRSVVGAGNDLLCGSPRSPCLLASPDGCDVALSGTAIDYLVRATMRRGALDHTVATNGAICIFLEKSSAGGLAGMRLVSEAVSALEEHVPWEGQLDAKRLCEVCRMCLVLARFEQFRRAGSRVWQYVGEPLLDEPTLGEYAKRVVPEACLLDLQTIGAAVIDDHSDLRGAEPLTLNPTFDLSVALGGADADLIANETLWDLKSTARKASVFGREELWQLIGYALADISDAYAIRSVGIIAVRRRIRAQWPLIDLLGELSGDSRSLKRWRAEFAEVVQATQEDPVARARLRAD